MKRIKIMLTAVIVLGTVGGVLAFKAKRSALFCTRSTVNGVCPTNARCLNGLDANVNAAGITVCYTTTDNLANCAAGQGVACNATTRVFIEDN